MAFNKQQALQYIDKVGLTTVAVFHADAIRHLGSAGKKWLTIKEAAEYATVSERTINSWRSDGLKSSKIGGVVKIQREWVDDFIGKKAEQNTESKIDKIANDTLRDMNL